MSSIFFYIFMAVGLSMDAFSLAIVYGTNGMKKQRILLLSVIVGIFHFVMPNLSGLLGKLFLILAIEMIFSFKEEDTKYKLDSWVELLLFGFAVSIDSFTVGLALSLENENLILAGMIFSIISAIFTFLGLLLGKLLSEKVGSISKIIGIIILFVFSIKYLFNI